MLSHSGIHSTNTGLARPQGRLCLQPSGNTGTRTSPLSPETAAWARLCSMRHALGSPLEGPVFKSSLVTPLGARFSTKGGAAGMRGPPTSLHPAQAGSWLCGWHGSIWVGKSAPAPGDTLHPRGRLAVFLSPPQPPLPRSCEHGPGGGGPAGADPAPALPSLGSCQRHRRRVPCPATSSQHRGLSEFQREKTKRVLAYPQDAQ